MEIALEQREVCEILSVREACKVENDSSPTRTWRVIWALSRQESVDWSAPANIGQQCSIFRLIWALLKLKFSRRSFKSGTKN